MASMLLFLIFILLSINVSNSFSVNEIVSTIRECISKQQCWISRLDIRDKLVVLANEYVESFAINELVDVMEMIHKECTPSILLNSISSHLLGTVYFFAGKTKEVFSSQFLNILFVKFS